VKEQMRTLPYVLEAHSTDTGLSVVVSDREKDVERLRQHLDGAGVHSVSIESAEPTYDDVFVRIIENDKRRQQDAQLDAPATSGAR